MTIAPQPTPERDNDRISRRGFVAGPLAAVAAPSAARAQSAPAARQSFAARKLPARTLPVPDTVSPELRAVIAAPYPPNWNAIPRNAAAWKKLAAGSAAAAAPFIAQIRQRMGI